MLLNRLTEKAVSGFLFAPITKQSKFSSRTTAEEFHQISLTAWGNVDLQEVSRTAQALACFTPAQRVYNSTCRYSNSSKIVALPGLDESEDSFDWFRKEGNTDEKFKQLLRELPHCDFGPLDVEQDLKTESCEIPNPYICNENGVFVTTSDGEQRKICSKIVIASALRDQRSQGWSRRLIVTDPDGVNHEWIMPMSQIAGDGRQVIEKLLDLGATIEPKTKVQLLQYLQSTPISKGRCTKDLGWNGESFVFPDESIQAVGKEAVRFHSESAADHRFYQRGSLQDWINNVAAPCAGNSTYVFGLSVGFASMLLELISEESFGINLHGSSSKGKTTLLSVAGSIFGGGDHGKYTRSWRATGNGLESVVAMHNSTLLCLGCKGPAMPNGRCRLHGGKSTGPQTNVGKSLAAKANWRHGHYSKQEKELRRKIAFLLRSARPRNGL